MDADIFWPRVLLAAMWGGIEACLLWLVIRDARAARRWNINGEVALAHEVLRRASRTAVILAVVVLISASAPSWRKDRAVIGLVLVVGIWRGVKSFRDRREAERLAQQKRLKRGLEGVEA